LDKTFSFQVQGFYGGPRKTASQDRQICMPLTLVHQKQLERKRNILFQYSGYFQYKSNEKLNYGDFTSENYMQWQPRQFALSLTYKFKQGEKVEQPKRKRHQLQCNWR
jgi:hypothetical protein